jgi:hypothetical protein
MTVQSVKEFPNGTTKKVPKIVRLSGALFVEG